MLGLSNCGPTSGLKTCCHVCDIKLALSRGFIYSIFKTSQKSLASESEISKYSIRWEGGDLVLPIKMGVDFENLEGCPQQS